MIDDFNTDVAELIKLAFLQFSCFHLLNLPDEFSTKTHMVLKKNYNYNHRWARVLGKGGCVHRGGVRKNFGAADTGGWKFFFRGVFY